MVFLVISLIATAVVTSDVGLFNGPAGLSLIPQPMSTALNLSLVGYRWFYVGLTAVICLIVYAFVWRITSAPLGRSLRAVRDHEQGAAALGKNVTGLRMTSFVVGGVIAGISGAVLVEFISAWSPGAWLYQETFVLFAAVIVGGTANNAGAALGALLVPVAFLEGSRFLPQFGPPGLIDALQWVAVGLLTLIFVWFWPRGVLPERRRIIPLPGLQQAWTGLQRPFDYEKTAGTRGPGAATACDTRPHWPRCCAPTICARATAASTPKTGVPMTSRGHASPALSARTPPGNPPRWA